jgi:hypothetical protein
VREIQYPRRTQKQSRSRGQRLPQVNVLEVSRQTTRPNGQITN